MDPENLAACLRERIREFGDKPAYILYPEELVAGIKHDILHAESSEDQGDGTIITRATFEGTKFLCVTEKN